MSERNLKILFSDISYILSFPFKKEIEMKELKKIFKSQYNELEKRLENESIIKDEINNLRKYIIENEKRNEGLLLKIGELKKNIDDLVIKTTPNDNICSICYENKINACCNPCGHLYCDKCIRESNSCYICRKNIITTIKIYI